MPDDAPFPYEYGSHLHGLWSWCKRIDDYQKLFGIGEPRALQDEGIRFTLVQFLHLITTGFVRCLMPLVATCAFCLSPTR